jgi:hypothetical protein
MLPLRFTFASESVKSKESNSQESNPLESNLKESNSQATSPNVALANVNSPKVAPLESWSQRYRTPICLMLTAAAGFISGYNLGRYRSKFS